MWVTIGLPYHSPHKFRHGHAVYALKNAKDVSALKAVSQNLMHADLSITDGVYGILSEKDVQENIRSLGKVQAAIQNNGKEEVVLFLEKLLKQVKAGKIT